MRVLFPIISCALALGCAVITSEDEEQRIDPDGDGVAWPNDCDDNNALIKAERVWYQDDDGDNVGGNVSLVHCIQPAGGVLTTGDCDDTDPDIHPLATERCNDIDDDCNGLIDDDCTDEGDP